jgi:hypothetical protein
MIRTVDEAIEALGGTQRASEELGVSPPAISNWKFRGNIPSDKFMLVTAALKVAGKTIDPRLFGFELAGSK